MSSLGLPPIQAPVNDPKALPGTSFIYAWAKWFSDLYNSIGGTSGAGAYFLDSNIPDVTSTTKAYIAVPRAGTMVKIFACLQGALSNHTETLTVTNASSSTTIGTLTFSALAPAGTVISMQPTSNNVLTAGQTVYIASAAASSNHVAAKITYVMQYSA